MALIDGQDRASSKPGEFAGYGVDSGTGAFMAAEALQAHQRQRDRVGESFDRMLFAELDRSYRHMRRWDLLETDGGTVAMFSSGYGDGAYPTFRGDDDTGRLVAVITDFGVVPWP